MAGEAVIAASNGAIVLDPDGKRMVHNAAADPCCGGTPCGDCASGPTTIDITISGLNITCPCDLIFGDPAGGVLTEVAGSIAGVHTLTRDPPTGIFSGFGSCVFALEVATVRATFHGATCLIVDSTSDYHAWAVVARDEVGGRWICQVCLTDTGDTAVDHTILVAYSSEVDCLTDFTAEYDEICTSDGTTHETASYSGAPA